MFPNPQDALPLPRRANLEHYRKIARELVQACKCGDTAAIGQWAEKWVNMVARKSGVTFTPGLPVAVSRWVQQVEEFAQRKLMGDGASCRLAGAQLVIARSHGFEHWSKFSKYLNAFEQKSSAVARFESAAAAIIEGDLRTLKRLLREEPALVRARSAREHGATLLHYVSANGVEGYRQKTPKNIVAVAEVLLKAGAEVDAAAEVYGGGATTLSLVATSIHPYRAGVQNELMDLLLNHGAEIAPPTGGDGQTPLHCAVITGHLETVKLLLKFNPPLEAKNIYGGTVLGQTLWSAAHGGDPKVYSEIIETLIAAGAKVPMRHVPVNKQIDDLLRKYGSEPEPTWYWYGEKPTA